MKKQMVLAGAAALGLLASSPASAATFLFDGAIAPVGFSISGTFITSDTANADGSFDILSTAAQFDNAGMLGTALGPTPYRFADNVLFVSGDTASLTRRGTGLLTSFGGQINLRFTDGSYVALDSRGNAFAFTSFSLTRKDDGDGGGGIIVEPEVPEPATWAMMLIGFVAVGGTLRSRRRNVRATVSFAR